MKELKLVQSLSERITFLQEEISGKQWSELSKEEFLYKAETCNTQLDAIKGILFALKEISKKKLEIEEQQVNALLKEIQKILKNLEATIKLEKHKTTDDFKKINPFIPASNTEAYWHLQEKMLSFALNTRYFIEKTNLSLAKSFLPKTSHSTQTSHLLELLEERDNEVVNLKNEIANLKKRAFLGYLKETTSSDIEEETKKISIEFEKKKSFFETKQKRFTQQIMSLEKKYIKLKEQLESLSEMFSDYIEKNNKLIQILKKERDLAKKTLLESENHLIELRNKYTNDILMLDQQKIGLEEKIKKQFIIKLKRALQEAKRNHEAVEHFRELLKRKEKEIAKLKKKKGKLK